MSASKAAAKAEDQRMEDAKIYRIAPLGTPSDLKSNAIKDISAALNALLSDSFALYMKTKNFHWHMSGPHFRDYHLLLDEQSEQIFAIDRSIGRARPQDRRHDTALDRRDWPQAAHQGQRRELCHAARHARDSEATIRNGGGDARMP